jgi:hypothetical protein
MSESQVSLFSGNWWLTVFFVGLGIHLIAAYVKPRLDRLGGWTSRSWANRNERRTHERQVRIDRLRRDETARWAAGHHELRLRIRSVGFLVEMGLLFLLGSYYPLRQDSTPIPHLYGVAKIAVLLIAIIAAFAAADDWFDAMRVEAELDAALKARDEAKAPDARGADSDDSTPEI